MLFVSGAVRGLVHDYHQFEGVGLVFTVDVTGLTATGNDQKSLSPYVLPPRARRSLFCCARADSRCCAPCKSLPWCAVWAAAMIRASILAALHCQSELSCRLVCWRTVHSAVQFLSARNVLDAHHRLCRVSALYRRLQAGQCALSLLAFGKRIPIARPSLDPRVPLQRNRFIALSHFFSTP
jgi:hypothetical protein